MNDYRLFLDSGTIINLSDGRQVSGVSRILPVNDRSYELVVFQQGRPVLDSELNLLQNILSSKLSELSNSILWNGWVWEAPTARDSNDASKAVFSSFRYIFNGNIIKFDDGNGFCTVNMGPKIQQDNRNDTIVAYIYREEIAAPGENNRLREQVKLYGNLNGVNIASDLLDPAIPDNLPTTRRVQLSYRIVSVNGDDLSKIPALNTDGQVIGYTFDYKDAGQGYMRAGQGDISSCNSIGSVDGYVYAIPLFSVARAAVDTGIDAVKVKPLINRFKLLTGNIPATEVSVVNNPDHMISGDSLQVVLDNFGQGISDIFDIVITCCQGILDGQSRINSELESLYNDMKVGG